MQFLDLTLPTPEENLALDEALLDEAEAAAAPRETLRLWESDRSMVVVGRGSQVAAEVNLAACERQGVPVLRRTSGGAAIVAGRGCLMYAVVLSYDLRPELRSIDRAHRFVLEATLGALRPLVDGVARRGTSDLAIGDLKFSGNSLRCKRRALLYHGTLFFDFDLSLVEALLTMPPRQPEYRNNRRHSAFLANLLVDRTALADSLVGAWQIEPSQRDWPHARVGDLVATRYSQRLWNLQR